MYPTKEKPPLAATVEITERLRLDPTPMESGSRWLWVLEESGEWRPVHLLAEDAKKLAAALVPPCPRCGLDFGTDETCADCGFDPSEPISTQVHDASSLADLREHAAREDGEVR